MRLTTLLLPLLLSNSALASDFVHPCNRTPIVTTILEGATQKKCTAITNRDLAQIRTFSFILSHGDVAYYPDVPELHKGDFSGLSGLEDIYASNIKLQKIEPGTFQGSSGRLRYLGLGNNSLSSLDPGALLGLESIQIIDLSFNPLSTFPTALKDIKGVRFLHLHEVPLTLKSDDLAGLDLRELSLSLDTRSQESFANGALQGLKNLTNLNLSCSGDLHSLPEALTLGLSALETLELRYGKCANLKVFAQEALAGATHLKTFRAFGLGDIQLDSDLFASNLELREVFIYGRSLPQGLPAGIFSRLKNLKQLGVSIGLPDQTIHASAFSNLPQLEELLLMNAYASIEEGAFEGNTNLKLIHLAGNRFKSLPIHLFKDLKALEKIDLRWSPLEPEEEKRLRDELGNKLVYERGTLFDPHRVIQAPLR